MDILFIKSKEDKNSFKIWKGFGFDIMELKNLDEVDNKIDEVIKKQCNTIVMTSEVANFSEDIITKYKKDNHVNIFIMKDKEQKRTYLNIFSYCNIL